MIGFPNAMRFEAYSAATSSDAWRRNVYQLHKIVYLCCCNKCGSGGSIWGLKG